jgi:hypothetical protein
MWLYDHWREERTTKWWCGVLWSGFVIVSGTFLMVGGAYGSVVDIMESYQAGAGTGAWSCADNSGSV